ncbi:MAG: hypothetical protein COV48_08280 [Elusimicrobia bacterium CG11_big_fil_rev_8_21_14_0_20_64_6]|nr:MAG: hypothetical protein COV48_08280 [Elusimicrobia bacterium CG11_big_fil_rev_8_21_14_0_20_64_6]
MTSRKRHPALETAVFAAALILAAFLIREFWSRRSAANPAPQETTAAIMEPVELKAARPAPVSHGRTEQAVTGVPPLKLSRVQPRKLRTKAVPAPR